MISKNPAGNTKICSDGVQKSDVRKSWWSTIKRWHPDLVLLDIRMPDFNGHNICTAIRMRRELDDLTVVFLTAEHTGKAEIERGLKMGASDYICRPVDGKILRDRIGGLVQQRHIVGT